MELQAIDSAKSIVLNDVIFSQEFNQGLIHEVLTAYMAGGRQGTKAQKNRSAVSGGGRKPWKQKGTGRARAGTIRSPLWRSGGVTFAAQPRDYSKKVNRKAFKAAMKSILSELVRQERLSIVNELQFAETKTKNAAAFIKQHELTGRLLVVTAEHDEVLLRSFRNIPYVSVCHQSQIDAYRLVSADRVILTADALQKLEERLA